MNWKSTMWYADVGGAQLRLVPDILDRSRSGPEYNDVKDQAA